MNSAVQAELDGGVEEPLGREEAVAEEGRAGILDEVSSRSLRGRPTSLSALISLSILLFVFVPNTHHVVYKTFNSFFLPNCCLHSGTLRSHLGSSENES